MVVIKIQGGLCNQLFQWAYGYALSKRYEVYFDVSFYKHKNLNSGVGTREFEISNILKTNIPLLTAESYQRFKSKEVKVIVDNFNFHNHTYDDNCNYYLDGYWQCSNYFNNYRSEILELFNFPKVLDYDFENSCSLHIRRGDYVNLQHIHPVQPIEYYKRALNYIKPKGSIFLFSDDINWCKNNIDFSNIIFMENNSNIVDLYYMSLCKDNILANSSFSWWGSYLSKCINKQVVAPSVWFGSKGPDSKDIYCEGWNIFPTH